MKNDKQEYKQAVLSGYRAIMQPLYREYGSRYSDSELRLEALKIITEHICSKVEDGLRKKRNYKKNKRKEEAIKNSGSCPELINYGEKDIAEELL